ncbi:hypothetical protein MOQ_009230 [Trypanosoma cruzi marinkellei]|uniref:Uncharacterized protein n=1 Tax=Trypanosoma cruzi marinkellei TaxID=85056 RepID=K2MXL1_TRYCR|nr:hypothetical protein MOQ_009230 [Trypanosoma cruzi marinkellei]
MQITPRQSGNTAPVSQLPIFSRSNSSVGPGVGGHSARPSVHLRCSLLRTPPPRHNRSSPLGTAAFAGTGGGGDSATSPSFAPSENYPFPSSGRRLERLHSGRRGPGQHSEEMLPYLDLDSVASEAETAANAMSREELESAVKELETENLMLKSAVLRAREELTKQREGLRETYEAAEKEGESIANHLTRRVNAVREQKSRLEAQLHKEEAMKAEQEQKLFKLKLSSSKLSKCVKREEEETLTTLTNRLQQLQTQRQNFENLLLEQSSSLQQLQELVDGFQTQTKSNEGLRMSHEGCSEADGDSNSVAADAMVPAEQHSFRSETTEHSDPASDPQEMLQYLKHEVAFVEGLQREAFERGERYKLRRQELEQRISHAESERRSNRHSLEGIHQELVETTATVSELASAAELAMETQIDRQIHVRGFTGSFTSGGHEFQTSSRLTESPKELTTNSAQLQSSPPSLKK